MSTEIYEPVPAAIKLRRVYCHRAVFEQALVPVGDDPPRPAAALDVNVSLQTRGEGTTEDPLGVRLSASLDPDAGKDQPYRVEVSYVGEFFLEGFPASADPQRVARVNCAAILFPYVRQTVSDLTSRGTSGPIILPALNIAAMLQRSEHRETGEGGEDTGGG